MFAMVTERVERVGFPKKHTLSAQKRTKKTEGAKSVF
jgi:hypothetical protein